MEHLYLNSDEAILLTTQDLLINGIRHEAVLTDRRLILVRRDDPKAPHREIPLAGIGSAIAGENALGEPTITLTMTAPDGVLQTTQLVFLRPAGSQGTTQAGEWVNRLKERIRVTVQEPFQAGTENGHGMPAAPPGASPSRKTRTPWGIVLVIAIVIAAAGGILAYRMLQEPAPAAPVPSVQPTGTPDAGAEPAAPPLPSPTPSPSLTPEPDPSPAGPALDHPVPRSGVWVWVGYAGAYRGQAGISGSMNPVNATGDRFFQIPATGGIIEAEIQKLDASGNLIAVELYHDGILVKRVTSTAPGAVVYLNAGL